MRIVHMKGIRDWVDCLFMPFNTNTCVIDLNMGLER